MATLPADRTKLALAQSNQVPGLAAGSAQNKNAITEAYDTIDLLNQKVDANVGAATLVPYPPAQYNQLINGNFDVWQRGTSFTTPSSGTYTADKYQVSYDGSIGTLIVSRQAFAVGQSVVPNNPQYFYRWDQTAAGSGSTFRTITTKIEGVRNFAGQICTLSFWAKSDSSRVVGAALRQYFGTGGSPSAQVDTASTSLTLTTSWQKFTVPFTLLSINGKTLGTNVDDCLQLLLGLPINTIMTIDIAQFQINAGNQALPFQPRSFTEELALCQRYYEKSYDYLSYAGTANYVVQPIAFASSSLAASTAGNAGLFCMFPFKVRKRITPTVILYDYDGTANAVRTGPANAKRAGVTGISNLKDTGTFQFLSFDNSSATAISTGDTFGANWTADAEL